MPVKGVMTLREPTWDQEHSRYTLSADLVYQGQIFQASSHYTENDYFDQGYDDEEGGIRLLYDRIRELINTAGKMAGVQNGDSIEVKRLNPGHTFVELLDSMKKSLSKGITRESTNKLMEAAYQIAVDKICRVLLDEHDDLEGYAEKDTPHRY